MPTRDVAARYTHEHVELRCKPRTIERVGYSLRTICVWYGDVPIADLGQAQAVDLHHRLPKSSATLTTSTLRSLTRWAHKHGFRTTESNIDPALAKVYAKPRTTVVLGDDARRFLAVLDEMQADGRCEGAIDCIRFLMSTGLRRDEARVLSWDRVADDCSSIYLDDSKTGPRHVVIGAQPRALLASRRQIRRACHVFPGRKDRAPVSARTVNLVMAAAAKRAGLHNVVVHSLRHSWATRALQLGVHNRLVQEALGWKSAHEIKRYQHVAADDLRDAVDRVSVVVKEADRG